MNIGIFPVQWPEFLTCTLVDGFLDLGHEVYDFSGHESNYMKRFDITFSPKIDLIIVANNRLELLGGKDFKTTKIIVYPYDRWTH